MSIVNILHLTDLHLKHADWDEQVLRRALLDDLKILRTSTTPPDLVLFSGDLVQSADFPGAYHTLEEYLGTVLDALGLNETNIILCPGNHDASRKVVGPLLPSVNSWRETAKSTEGANSLVIDSSFKNFVSQGFHDCNASISKFGSPHLIRKDEYSSTYILRHFGFSIVSLNTALLTKAGLTQVENEDLEQLFVAERSLTEALDATPRNMPAIVIGHHPLSWLNPTNRSLVEKILGKRALAYFSGHLHDANPWQSHSLAGDTLFVQSGALYMGRKRWNGYAVVSLKKDSGHARISYRRWFEQRREFSKAEDLAPDGTFYNSSVAEDTWNVREPKIDADVLIKWREDELVPALKKECNDCFSVGGLDKVFVAPEFDREVPYKTEADGQIGSRVEILSFDAIAKSNENFIVSARSESGKTTALKRLSLEISTQFPINDRPMIPVLLQFGAMRNYSQYTETLIRQKLPDLPENISLKDLLINGNITILVDDVEFSRDPLRKSLVTFIETYPKCRYILASSTAFVESSSLQPEVSPSVPFTRVRMMPLKQNQLLSLIENHGTTDPFKADKLLERVVRDASALNVPLTAVTGTFLIQILNEEPDHTVLNQAGFVERYLEMVLEKYAPKELLPGSFDFKNKVDLLCTIAEFMVKANDYTPPENTVLEWCVNYLKGYGLNFSARDLLTYFIEARVLELSGGCVRFRLKMFFEFIVATRMVDDNLFKEFILDDQNYLSFINEIGFYAAINRKDKSLIDNILSKFSDLSNEVSGSNQKVTDIDKFLKEFKAPGKSASERDILEIQESVRTEQQIRDDRALLSDGAEYAESTSQDIIRPIFLTSEERWLASLILLSGLVKNTELIPDWDKRRYLKEVIQGWVRVTVNSLGIISSVAKDKRVVFNGITYRSTLPDSLPIGEIARRLALSMPIATARMASVFLSTEKLRPQLEDGIGSDEESPARQFLRLAILADMAVDNIVDLSKRVSSKLRDQGYLSLVLMRKLHEVVVRFRLPRHTLQAIRSTVADMYVGLERVPRNKVAHRRAEIIAGMERQRLRVEYKASGRGGTIIVIDGSARKGKEASTQDEENIALDGTSEGA